MSEKKFCGHNFESLTKVTHSRPCKECGTKNPCDHRPTIYTCDCGRKSLCKHGKAASYCIECGGGSICPHMKLRSRCFECGGSAVCIHQKRRYQCIECGGKGICPHKRRIVNCIECGGTSICQHKKQRSNCADCKRTARKKLLQKKKPKQKASGNDSEESFDVQVSGRGTSSRPKIKNEGEENEVDKQKLMEAFERSAICGHGILRFFCVQCGGEGICKHKNRKYQCDECIKDEKLVASENSNGINEKLVASENSNGIDEKLVASEKDAKISGNGINEKLVVGENSNGVDEKLGSSEKEVKCFGNGINEKLVASENSNGIDEKLVASEKEVKIFGNGIDEKLVAIDMDVSDKDVDGNDSKIAPIGIEEEEEEWPAN